jgi:phosphate:Na+ symporter
MSPQLLLGVSTRLLASSPADTGVDLQPGVLLMGLLGGLALFLYGMDKLADALKTVLSSPR